MREGITVIVPTIGRASLEATLRSFAPDLSHADAVVVLADGKLNAVQQLVLQLAEEYPAADWMYSYEGVPLRDFGHPLRNLALDLYVETSHVWTIDDDDIAALGALRALRDQMAAPWAIFRMIFGENHFARGLTCWRQREINAGDIGTPMVFAPLSKARFGLRYMGDLDYARDLQDELGEPVWDETIIAIIRPEAQDEVPSAA